MSARLGFAAGLAVGVLAGSRAGRGIYDRSASAASAVVHDPRVRSGASAALHRAGSAGSTVAGAAARKVTGRGKKAASEDGESPGVEGDGERRVEGGGQARVGKLGGRGGKVSKIAGGGKAGKVAGSVTEDGAGDPRVEHRVTMKRLMGGVRGHRNGGGGRVAGQEHVFLRHGHRSGHRTDGNDNVNGNGVSAPSVQAKPKGGNEGSVDGGSSG